MLNWIAAPFRQFGPISGGSSPPPQPQLSIVNNANGTATATIAGGDAGASNPVMVTALPSALGAVNWSLSATINGNNAGTLSLPNGLYLAQVQAAESGLYSLLSNTVAFQVTGGSTTALTQTPAGNYPIGLAGVAWLVASSASFQALVGASGALQAFEHVAFEADDTEESGSSRPRAIVFPAPGGFQEQKVSLVEFRPHMTFWVSLEALPPGALALVTPRQTRLKDEMLWFANTMQAILDDCKANQGQGTGYLSGISQVSCSQIRLFDGPNSMMDARAEGELGEVSEYFYGATLEFVIHG